MTDHPPLLPLARIALFLDLDGTLIELAPRPGDVRVSAALLPLLEQLHARLGGAMAVISGRPLADIDRLLAPLHLPAAGTHGAELREAAGAPVHLAGEPLPGALRERLSRIAKELQSQWHGVSIEDKTSALAIHYRLAPEAEPALRAALDRLALPDGWQILAGHCVYEIRARDRNKGAAVSALTKAAPFAGRQPVFVGDDRTDLDGMAAAVRLGGHGIAVGGLDAPDAEWSLPSVAAVHDWLRELLAA
ncbi:MAG TPA: trehalose-phosphatase [Dongiaceae bacterium]|nr:trehalose-phosphatase [Dongiaceae bacterium]